MMCKEINFTWLIKWFSLITSRCCTNFRCEGRTMMAKAMNLTQLIMFSLITFRCRRRQKMAKEMNFTQLIKWVGEEANGGQGNEFHPAGQMVQPNNIPVSETTL
ncbi:hypothetical protein AABB24_004199 [Solanum stoloniferum]|uniref:Uncharacterized protein n=1 Tax=Solanum stoloniferum TaxID=62892 RepID=A0ABD2VAT0_9SOLN